MHKCLLKALLYRTFWPLSSNSKMLFSLLSVVYWICIHSEHTLCRFHEVPVVGDIRGLRRHRMHRCHIILVRFSFSVRIRSRSSLLHSFRRFISNKYLRRHTHRHMDVEWGYAFDVHLNAFFPVLIILHVFQLFFYHSKSPYRTRIRLHDETASRLIVVVSIFSFNFQAVVLCGFLRQHALVDSRYLLHLHHIPWI